MLKIAICDDNQTHMNGLKKMLQETVEESILMSCFTTPKELLSVIQKKHFDLVFLDVEFSEENGIDAGMIIRMEHPQTKIIYITGYPHYAQDVFETEPSYILLKPFHEEKLRKALAHALKNSVDHTACMVVTYQGVVTNIPYEEIRFIESKKRIAQIHGKDQVLYKTYSKLDELENGLPDSFLRCHKSYILNMDYVRELTNDAFVLYSGAIIPIAQRRAAEVRKTFFDFIEKARM